MAHMVLKNKLPALTVRILRFPPDTKLALCCPIQNSLVKFRFRQKHLDRKKKILGPTQVWRSCNTKIDYPALSNLHFFSDFYFNTFDVPGLTFYCTFCKTFLYPLTKSQDASLFEKRTKNIRVCRGLHFL